VAEASGVKEFDGDIWYGLYAPNDTPRAVVAKINADVNALLGDPEIASVFARQGLTTMGGKPEALADLTRDDLAKWTRVVRNANIKVD
jgi:tripartite-type tricarboxylate transporter receptor subunit TctC